MRLNIELLLQLFCCGSCASIFAKSEAQRKYGRPNTSDSLASVLLLLFSIKRGCAMHRGEAQLIPRLIYADCWKLRKVYG